MMKNIGTFVNILYYEKQVSVACNGVKSVCNIPCTWEINLEYYMW